MTKPWYEELYEHFPSYDEEPYVQNTENEIAFLQEEINHPQARKILDVGCGTGRHALALAKEGYRVVGFDLSEAMLAQGMRKAHREGLPVTFVQGDARQLTYQAAFDVVIMLCEGGFSLVETDAMDRRILSGIYRALVPGGQVFLTAPSAVGMLASQPEGGDFDLRTLRESFTIERRDPKGVTRQLQGSQRYYTYPELAFILQSIGFIQPAYFAVTENGYARNHSLTKDQFEIGVSAKKPLKNHDRS